MSELAGQVAIVTGGGTGIGLATSLRFAQAGAHVVVNYSRSEKEAAAAVARIREAGGEAIAVLADVSRDNEVRAMVDETIETFGRLDVLVNNAGYTRPVAYTDLEGLTEDIWDRVLAVNVKGTFFASRAAICAMREHGSGQIINVASLAAITGQGSSIAYAAAKAAMICMTQAMAVSQAPEIRVNAVAPGVVETRWIAAIDERYLKPHREGTPLGRFATPDDIATAIYSLAVNDYITGQTLIVDGGRILQH